MMHRAECSEPLARGVYESIDVKRSRSVAAEDWVSSFTRLAMPFSAETVNDLFSKADANGDGRVSCAEFIRFAELFPATVCCMWYRERDRANESQVQAAIDEARQELDACKRGEVSAAEAKRVLSAAVGDAKAKLEEDARKLTEASEWEQAAVQECEDRREDVRKKRNELSACGSAVAAAHDQERKCSAAAADARRRTEAAARRLAQQEAALRGEEERTNELERMLLEQRRQQECRGEEVARAQQALAAATDEERQASDARAAALAGAAAASDRQTDAQSALAESVGAEAAAAEGLSAAQRGIHAARRQVADQEREVHRAREAENLGDEELMRHATRCESQERRVSALEADRAELSRRRSAQDDEERELLEQEVRLRQQRECLEAKEASHRRAFGDFQLHHAACPENLSAPRVRSGYCSPQRSQGTSPARARYTQMA